MAVTDYFTELGINVDIQGLFWGISFLGILALILIVFGAIFIFITQQSKYNFKIIVFENISGEGYKVTKKDKAKLVKVGKSGEQLLYLKKSKTYKVAYGQLMSKNTYWFAIGDDGYWYNIVLEGLDKAFSRLGVKPVHTDMRYAYASMMNLTEERYNVSSFWKDHGATILTFTGFFVIAIFIWLIFKEFSTITGSLAGITNEVTELLEVMKDLINSMNNIQRSSGVTPVT